MEEMHGPRRRVGVGRRGGWRRLGRKSAFRYEDAAGRSIGDETRLERIESLVIPPAWRDVWISPSASADLQATGVDAAGRRQYLYHPDFRAAQDRAKFDRLVRFGELLPDLRAATARHVRLEPFAPEWTLAHAATLINRAWFRVGSERYAETSRTYGVTTLQKRHVSVRGRTLRFGFRAKHRVLVRTTLVDPGLADGMRELLRLPGGARLFRFRENGAYRSLTGPLLNEYLAEHLGGGFTAKDFRTWGGTLTAAIALAEHGPPESDAEARRAVAAAMRRVGEQLGNTPSVARSSYVSPAVIEQFHEGRTLEHFRPRAERALSASADGLDLEEQSLLALLRSWRVRRAQPRPRTKAVSSGGGRSRSRPRARRRS
jgi:DNA topoisomerase I